MFNKTVKCNTCKCLLKKKDAHEVNIIDIFESGICKDFIYYCETHAVKYYQKVTEFFPKKSISHYYREIKVDSKGVPIGYRKIKK